MLIYWNRFQFTCFYRHSLPPSNLMIRNSSNSLKCLTCREKGKQSILAVGRHLFLIFDVRTVSLKCKWVFGRLYWVYYRKSTLPPKMLMNCVLSWLNEHEYIEYKCIRILYYRANCGKSDCSKTNCHVIIHGFHFCCRIFRRISRFIHNLLGFCWFLFLLLV